ncbi:MAG: exonuclease domain-containing protein [Huintestinicola sp.]
MFNSSAVRIKGKKLFTAESDYTVFDLETTSNNPISCKIIEISAIKVKNNEIVDRFTALVNPEIHIPHEATKINHITDEMVESAPTIEAVFDSFMEFIGDDILIGHNIDSFDYNIIYDLHIRIKNIPFSNAYIDTFHLAKRCLPELENHRLSTLAGHLGIEVKDAHRAESDCITTHNIYQNLKPLIGIDHPQTMLIKKATGKSSNQYATVEGHNPFYDKTCIVYGAFKNIDTDKIKHFVQSLGANYVDFFCYSADYLVLGTDMYNKFINGIPDEMIDGILNRTNVRIISENDFISYSEAVLTLNANTLDISFMRNVSGKTVCLTGDFECGEREAIENTLVAKGAIVKSGVIKKLDYLVIGANGSPDWKDGIGSKRIKAEEYNQKGGQIAIIDENDFIE